MSGQQQQRKRAPQKRKAPSDHSSSGASKKQSVTVTPTDEPGSRRIIIVKQPNAEFYKDEGGKSNYLMTAVTIVEYDDSGKLTRSPNEEFVSIPLRVTLYFESETRVEEKDQDILRLVGNEYDKLEIRPESRSAIIKFRLEKVSRRKDGQRFKLKIEPDPERMQEHPWKISPIFTNPICVLSKRKSHGGSDSGRSLLGPGPRLSPEEFTRFEARMNDKIDTLQATVSQLVSCIETQNQKILSLETIVRQQQEQLQQQQQQRPSLAMEGPADMVKKERVPISPCSPKSFLVDEVDIPTISCRVEGDFLVDFDYAEKSLRKVYPATTARFDRISAADMTFNFGVPSSPVSYGVDTSLLVE